MKKKVLWLTLVLALVLTLTLIPFSAMASESQQTEEITQTSIPFQVNPLYKDLYGDAAVHRAPAPVGSVENQAPVLNATYVTEAKAAQQIRDKMEAWTEEFTIYVKSENSDYEELFYELMGEAMAHTGNPKEGDYLLWHYEGWGADVSRVDKGGSYEYTYTIYVSYYTTAAQEKELDTAVSNLLKSLNVGKKSDYQKVKAVYDYICANITYDYENLEDPEYMLKHTAYAALVDKTAVCQGYASLMYRLLLELDVDTRVIAGESLDGVGHGWNIAKLGDVYYNLDSTWDAGMSQYSYFLKNSEGFLDHLRYLEYASTQFHTDYPMSATDYVDGVAGKPEHVFAWGYCGDEVLWEVDRDKVLTISGTGEIYDFESADHGDLDTWSPWTYWMDGFTSVVIEDGITGIGDYSFDDMPNLKTVTLPETLTTIGNSAFRKTSITGVKLPSSLKEIGEDAFYYCEKLEKIWIPYQVTTIGRNAFWCCYNLKDLTLGSGLTYIGDQAFRETAVTEVVIPDKVTTLGSMAFYCCDNLKSVTLGKSMTEVPNYAFGECYALTEVTIPEGVTQIRGASFQNCKALPEVTFPATLEDLDGFDGCDKLKKITFLGHAPSIGSSTFYGVTATVYYPDDATWTDDVLQDYGGNLTWVSTHVHDYSGTPVFNAEAKTHSWTCAGCGKAKTEKCTFNSTILKAATMDEPGVREYTCTVCGGSYQETVMYRISGSGRCETALAAADELKEILGVASFDTIIIASGDKFADALTGSYLAAKESAPILLFSKGYEDELAAYVDENLTDGGKVYILGGASSVPETVIDALVGYDLERLAGDTRFETNLKILEEAGAEGEEILVCTAYNFADSLSASAVGKPILLVDKALTEGQKDFVSGSSSFAIIGGVNSVSEAIETELSSFGTVTRISGASREETSVAVAQKYFGTPEYAVLAYSRNFPDGLCGGPLAYALGAPLLLTNSGAEAAAADYTAAKGITKGVILGGPNSISDATAGQIFLLEN